MEITESSYPVFCACRLFGYAPYRIRRNKSGRVVHIRRSRALSAYGLAAITTLGEQQRRLRQRRWRRARARELVNSCRMAAGLRVFGMVCELCAKDACAITPLADGMKVTREFCQVQLPWARLHFGERAFDVQCARVCASVCSGS